MNATFGVVSTSTGLAQAQEEILRESEVFDHIEHEQHVKMEGIDRREPSF